MKCLRGDNPLNGGERSNFFLASQKRQSVQPQHRPFHSFNYHPRWNFFLAKQTTLPLCYLCIAFFVNVPAYASHVIGKLGIVVHLFRMGFMHVKGCVLCFCKPTNRKLGMGKPLLTFSHPWGSVFMDFVRGSHMSKVVHFIQQVHQEFREHYKSICIKKGVRAQLSHLSDAC